MASTWSLILAPALSPTLSPALCPTLSPHCVSHFVSHCLCLPLGLKSLDLWCPMCPRCPRESSLECFVVRRSGAFPGAGLGWTKCLQRCCPGIALDSRDSSSWDLAEHTSDCDYEDWEFVEYLRSLLLWHLSICVIDHTTQVAASRGPPPYGKRKGMVFPLL